MNELSDFYFNNKNSSFKEKSIYNYSKNNSKNELFIIINQLNDDLVMIVHEVRHSLHFISTDYVKQLKEKLNKIIYGDEIHTMQHKEKSELDKLYLFIFSEELVKLTKYNKEIHNYFIDISKDKDLNIQSEVNKAMNELHDKLKTLYLFSVTSFIENSLSNYFNSLAIEEFFTSSSILLSCCNNWLVEVNVDPSTISSKSFSDFMFQFFEERVEKLKQSIDCDDYTPVNIVSPTYQEMINFISNESLKDLLKESSLTIIKHLEKVNNSISLSTTPINCNDQEKPKEKDMELTDDIIKSDYNATSIVPSSDSLNKGLLTINSKQFKCCFSMFEIIKFVYDIVKLFLLFKDAFQEQLFLQVSYLNLLLL